MVKPNTSRYLPPLRLVEKSLSNEEITKRLDTAFGMRWTVKSVSDRGEYKYIEIREHHSYISQQLAEWDWFYEALDEHGSLWIPSGKLEIVENNDSNLTTHDYDMRASLVWRKFKLHIFYSVEPEPGYWEVKYAIKNTGPRISTALLTPRYVPPPPRRSGRIAARLGQKPEPETPVRGEYAFEYRPEPTVEEPVAVEQLQAPAVEAPALPKKKKWFPLYSIFRKIWG